MKRMEIIETSIGQAKELSRLKNNFAAWEIVEKAHRQFPEDSELNRIRADLTIRVSAFAAAMAKAEEALESGDKWTALLAYLKAKDIYPMSLIADSEISKLANQILDK